LIPIPFLVLEVDGPGIPDSEYDKVFTRFYREKGCGYGFNSGG
jgi:signal transduction histidine kinase